MPAQRPPSAQPTKQDQKQDQKRPDTRDMLVVHTAFRREFRLMAGLVRATAVGDVRRAKVVSDHLTLITTLLHHHHGGEDRLLWPLLLERADDEYAPLILLMEAQHERVSAQLDRVEELQADFASNAGQDAQITLAAACDGLYTLLEEHLAAEEQQLLPLAERYVGAAEWSKMGEEGTGTLPKRQTPLAFGFMMYEGDPEVIAHMLAPAPLPVRKLMPYLARSSYRRYALRVHGTSTPRTGSAS